jgi:hypothetical protein
MLRQTVVLNQPDEGRAKHHQIQCITDGDASLCAFRRTPYRYRAIALHDGLSCWADLATPRFYFFNLI